MTEKELLYVEDALGHEKYFQTQCSETIGRIQDPTLRSLAEQIGQQHSAIFHSFYE